MTTINTIHDLHRILVEHPEWRDELRRILLTEELLELPQRFAEYAKATDEKLDALITEVRQNTSDIRQNTTDIAELKDLTRQNTNHIGELKGMFMERTAPSSPMIWACSGGIH